MTRILILLVISHFLFQGVSADAMRAGEELEALREKIDGLQSRLKTARQQSSELTKNLEDIEKETLRLQIQRKDMELELETLTVNKMQKNAHLFELEQKVDTSQLQLKNLAKTSFMLGQAEGLKLVLNDGNPTEKLRALTLIRYMVTSSNRAIEEIYETQNQHRQALNELEIQRVKIDKVLNRMDDNAKKLKAQQRSRLDQLVKIKKQTSDDQSLVDTYRLREKELELLLEGLRQSSIQASLKRNHTQQEPKKQSSTTEQVSQDDARTNQQVSEQPTSEVVGSAGSAYTSAKPVLATDFRKNKGRLSMPAKGKMIKRFGDIRPESGLKWDGLMLDVQLGQSVSAIYDGQVVFSDWFGSFGQLLVIDHGDGYMSLYGHNQALHVGLGGAVKAGQVIASAGNTGGLQNPSLYFEIRDNGIPSDPLQWCRL